MVITTSNFEGGGEVRFKDAEGWDTVVLTGHAIFNWEASNDTQIVYERLEFYPIIPQFNDINSCAPMAAPSSFSRFTGWGYTLWAVDSCSWDYMPGFNDRIRIRVKLALQGNRAGLARVAFILTIKGHLKPDIPPP